jgi:hypothetical protein
MIIINWKGCGRKYLWLNFEYWPGILIARIGINHEKFLPG